MGHGAWCARGLNNGLTCRRRQCATARTVASITSSCSGNVAALPSDVVAKRASASARRSPWSEDERKRSCHDPKVAVRQLVRDWCAPNLTSSPLRKFVVSPPRHVGDPESPRRRRLSAAGAYARHDLSAAIHELLLHLAWPAEIRAGSVCVEEDGVHQEGQALHQLATVLGSIKDEYLLFLVCLFHGDRTEFTASSCYLPNV